jgi:hypothetical protein
MKIADMINMPSLEQQSIEACGKELGALLDRYNCQLVFQEVRHNGQVVTGGFTVIKKPN